MAYTTIDDPEAYFQVKTYTGNGSADHAMTFDGDTNMQPDLVWIKTRSNSSNHQMHNSLTSETYHYLRPNADVAEITSNSDALTSFNSDGFTIGSDGVINENNYTYVAWCWKGGTTSGISGSGDITPSAYSFNQTSGVSIIQYTGTLSSSGTDTVLHGLNAVPKFFITKQRNSTSVWYVWHTSLTSINYRLNLNDSPAEADGSGNGSMSNPTSTVIDTNHGGGLNESSQTYQGLIFAEKQGFSKFGSYNANNNVDGPYIHLGFKPAFLLIKEYNNSEAWILWDNKRDPYNEVQKTLVPNNNNAEDTSSTNDDIDFLSNGFKIRCTSYINNSGGKYAYVAFAEAPFVNSNGVPCNAR